MPFIPAQAGIQRSFRSAIDSGSPLARGRTSRAITGDRSKQTFEDFGHVPLHLLRFHLNYTIVPLAEVGAPLRARLDRLGTLLRRHEVDDASERKGDEIDNVRTDRHLAFEAATRVPAVVGQAH